MDLKKIWSKFVQAHGEGSTQGNEALYYKQLSKFLSFPYFSFLSQTKVRHTLVKASNIEYQFTSSGVFHIR